MLELKNVSLSVGARTLLENASATAFPGDKIGIVGPNGCGKTTLLNAIIGNVSIDSGEIVLAKNIDLVYLRQEMGDASVKLLDFVVSADRRLAELRKKLRDSTDDLAEIYDQIWAIGGNSAEARASVILAGLGFKNDDLSKALGEFSGGWQVRASLAATLFAPADILILDEPTNHLDLESVIWLESFLMRSDKILLIVSHEKAFLDNVCNKILNISGAKLRSYSGNYSTFIRTKEEQDLAAQRMAESQEQKREHIQSFVDRFRYKATKAKQVQSRIKMLGRLEPTAQVEVNYSVRFVFGEPSPKVDRHLVTLENVSAGYGSKTVLRDINMRIDCGERMALLGANGNGKSTLAKIISRRLEKLSGNLEYAKNLKIAYFSQQQTDELDIHLNATEMFKIYHRELNETQIRSALANFGLIRERTQTKIALLSGGEKTRLLLAIVTSQRPHLLLLDEPTNHLDIEAREALIDALAKYSGAAILITHDFHTLEACCKHFYIVADGTCKPFKGTLAEYKSFLLAQRDLSAKPNGKARSPRKRGDGKMAKQMANLEETIKTLSEEKTALEHEISEKYSEEACERYEKICSRLEAQEEDLLALMELQ